MPGCKASCHRGHKTYELSKMKMCMRLDCGFLECEKFKPSWSNEEFDC
jgi:hypothetical protein